MAAHIAATPSPATAKEAMTKAAQACLARDHEAVKLAEEALAALKAEEAQTRPCRDCVAPFRPQHPGHTLCRQCWGGGAGRRPEDYPIPGSAQG